MKRIVTAPCFFLSAVVCTAVMLGTATRLPAQAPEGPDTTESTTEDSTGTVVSVSPSFTVTVTDRRGPFTYRLGQDLHIFGPDNHSLKIEEVHPGDEVTVFYYFRDNHPTVARMVVLRRGKPPARK